jgi:type IV pilus assembly protein PilE
MMMNTMNHKGFTLIEIMVVVAIVGILTTIVLPAYNEHVRSSRRAAIQACLMDQVHFMERFYAANMTYVGANPPACQGGAAGFYNMNIPVQTATTYSLTATATGDQASDKASTCNKAELVINHTGARTPADCW